MTPTFDVRTAYLLLGVLSLAAALGVHVTLRVRRRARHETWVMAGLCFGMSLMLIAARGHVPEVLTYDASHVFLVGAALLYASALGAEFGRGWTLAGLVAVVALSTAIYATLTRLDRGIGLSYNVLVLLAGGVYITVMALRVWLRTRHAAALAIVVGFGSLALALCNRLLSLSPSFGSGGAFEANLAQTMMMVSGLTAVILANLGYLGLQFIRISEEQIAAERQAAIEAERARQTREQEMVLRGLLEERNQLIQRIARNETASDLAQFATSLPHELSQPLCASQLSLESLRTVLERQGDPALLPVVRAIETSNERVLDLLQQLRILLRSHESSDREVVDLRSLVQRTVPILEGSFREHGIRLAANLPDRPFEVLASATQLQQLLLILCTHALDDLRRQPAGEGGQQVRVGLELDAREVRLRVEDSGQRSGADLRRQLGAETSQGPWTQEAGDRRGLGLAVARRVAEAHMGRLDIRESWLGGAAFVLTLPTAQAATELAASAPAITPPPRQTSPS